MYYIDLARACVRKQKERALCYTRFCRYKLYFEVLWICVMLRCIYSGYKSLSSTNRLIRPPPLPRAKKTNRQKRYHIYKLVNTYARHVSLIVSTNIHKFSKLLSQIITISIFITVQLINEIRSQKAVCYEKMHKYKPHPCHPRIMATYLAHPAVPCPVGSIKSTQIDRAIKGDILRNR